MIRLHTSLGVIDLELDHDKAPVTSANVESYASEGFYDGTLFHRVIPGFMVQGGGLDPGMVNKPTKDSIKNEADNGLKNDIGTVAMARTNDPHSATAQFFINVSKNDFLNHQSPTPQGWGYCVFGKVVDGMEVVSAIVAKPTGNTGGHGDVPVEDILIERAEVIS